MTYRRRGYSQSRRRRPARKLMWLRDALNAGQTVTQGTMAVIDLLWLLRHPPAAGALLEDGQRLNRAAGDTAVAATKDVTGGVIKRIRLDLVVTSATAAWNADDGMFIGIQTGPALDPQAITFAETGETTTPRSERGANTEDWLWWERNHLWNPMNTALLTDNVGAFDFATNIHKIDTRCARKIEDWGDSLIMSLQPSFTTANDTVVTAAWSVLIALP